MLAALAHDLRGASRRMGRAPALAAAVVGILGLALAASIATFAVLNAVLLEPLPYREPQRVVFLRHLYKEMVAACSPPTFLDYVTVAQAQADVQSVIATLRARHPRRYTERSGFRVLATPLQEEIVGPSRAGLVLVLAAVVTLLLVAATNVAGLLLARAAGRRRENAVRTALGASRSRLAREALAEAAVLATAAGGGGLLLAHGLCAVSEAIDRVTLPRARAIAVDFEVAAFALAATLAVALVAGLAPAWHARRDVMAWLRTNPPGAGGRDVARARRLLIVA